MSSKTQAAKCPGEKSTVTVTALTRTRCSLKKTEVTEHNTLPTTEVIQDEKIAIEEKNMMVALGDELKGKDQVLKKTATVEKNPLPTKAVIEAEKVAIVEKQLKDELNKEVKCDHKLNPTDTTEKNPLPTKEDIAQEKAQAQKK